MMAGIESAPLALVVLAARFSQQPRGVRHRVAAVVATVKKKCS
jgi:hypothetical protein